MSPHIFNPSLLVTHKACRGRLLVGAALYSALEPDLASCFSVSPRLSEAESVTYGAVIYRFSRTACAAFIPCACHQLAAVTVVGQVLFVRVGPVEHTLEGCAWIWSRRLVHAGVHAGVRHVHAVGPMRCWLLQRHCQ